jgi:hypothetical protein
MVLSAHTFLSKEGKSGICERFCEKVNLAVKGVDYILYICYGNHSRASSNKEKAEDLIIALRSRHSMQRDELMDYLGYDSEDENQVRSFDRLLSPLRGDNALDVQLVKGFTQNGEKYYSLSRNTFDASIQKMIKSVRDSLEEAENQRIKELSEKIDRAEGW